MSRAPFVTAKPARGYPRGDRMLYDSTLGWRFPNSRMEAMFPLESMGETGENVAERWRVSREDQDAFALESQRRWAAAEEWDGSPVSWSRWATSTATSTRGRRRTPRAGRLTARVPRAGGRSRGRLERDQ